MKPMLTSQMALDLILKALQNLNDELSEDARFDVGVKTALFGPDAALDSLSLVSVIVDVESGISELLGYSISLTDDRAMSQEISPFDTVESLLNYVMLLANER